jgi:hypothetical protein
MGEALNRVRDSARPIAEWPWDGITTVGPRGTLNGTVYPLFIRDELEGLLD